MKIEFEGWERNHGSKTMIHKAINASKIVDNPFPLGKEEIKVEVLKPETHMADGVRILFGTEMRLGGSQMGTITLSTAELAKMFRAAVADKPFSKVVELLS